MERRGGKKCYLIALRTPLRTTGTPQYAAITARTESTGVIVRKKQYFGNTLIKSFLRTMEVDEKEDGEDLTTREDEQPSGFENGMEFFVEVPIKEEMDFMEMINNKP
ncbi:hypothetical protein TSUD_174200 [Trifolium subterraneum]|nr:hypothetical protein TSUD_174200 [Trifolium subterraneum]